ncbi:hypothetical protein WJX82_000603 [Trebouxia sp. C0006]
MSLPSFKHAAASLLQVVAALHEKEHFIGAFMPDRLLLDSDDTLYLLDFTTGTSALQHGLQHSTVVKTVHIVAQSSRHCPQREMATPYSLDAQPMMSQPAHAEPEMSQAAHAQSAAAHPGATASLPSAKGKSRVRSLRQLSGKMKKKCASLLTPIKTCFSSFGSHDL